MTLQENGFNTPIALALFVAGFGVLGLVLLSLEASPTAGAVRGLRGRLLRALGGPELSSVDVPWLTGVAAGAFAVGALTTALLGEYGCTSGGPSDLLTLVTSGRAFLSGGNPFTITACGVSTNPVPAGLASVLLDALGSLGGGVGVLVVWGVVSVALVPLLWTVGGPDRARAGLFVLGSFLYLPIVAVQVDGASLAIVPMTVLLALYLGRRQPTRAAAVGGFLATGRFPALFPVVALTGRAGARRWTAGAAAVAPFAIVTLLLWAVYGGRFLGPVFLTQFSRSHFALNYWGVLEGWAGVQPSTALTVAQGLLTVVLVAVCWLRARSDLGAVAIVLTGTVLLTQFLSFTELVFLVPVALVGARARWWLWAIGVVAATNYLLALRSLADVGRPFALSYALDLVLTALLLGLFVDLVRPELGRSTPSGPALRPSGLAANGGSR